MINKIWTWLHSSDALTWAGHGLQAIIIVAVADLTSLGLSAGIYATLIHFSLREGPGLVIAVVWKDTQALIDGLGDLFAPIAGIALWVLVTSLLV